MHFQSVGSKSKTVLYLLTVDTSQFFFTKIKVWSMDSSC